MNYRIQTRRAGLGAAAKAAPHPGHPPARTTGAICLAPLDVGRDRPYGHRRTRSAASTSWPSAAYIRSLYPPKLRLHFVLDDFSAHR
jgi:hypothetical protein